MAQDSSRVTGSLPAGAHDAHGGQLPGALISAFAHEMRNALGPVRTASYLLRASASDAQAQWALDLIDRQVQAITASIEALADYALLARGALELQSVPIDFRDVVDGAASACAVTLTEKRQTLKWARPAAEIQVRGDRARLTQAVTAVLRSASRATAAGGHIPVSLEREAREVATSVGDLPDPQPAAPSTLFDVGAAAGSPAGADAPGLGLSLAQSIIEHHGGALIALGSQFAIRLPLVENRD